MCLKIPKLRTLAFETAIVERYKRQKSSVEEALLYGGTSHRRR